MAPEFLDFDRQDEPGRLRRPGWRRLLERWSPALEALVSHTQQRFDGDVPSMKDEAGANDKVGDLAGGFNRIARDFDRALHLARLSAMQLFLIQQAREMSWTSAQIANHPTSYPFRLNLSEVARRAHAERRGVQVQHGKLVAARIFNDLGDGRFLINKDFRTWLDEGGQPLLAADQVAWCIEARRKKKGAYLSTQPPAYPDTQAGSSEVRTPVPRAEESTTHPLRTPVPRAEESTTQAGSSGVRTPVPDPDPSPRTPIYEARTPTPAGTPAELRVSEEENRDPEENPPPGGAGGVAVGEDLLMELIREAKNHVHFLIDPLDSTYMALRRKLKVWLAKPLVDRELILQAYAEASGAASPPGPRGFPGFVDAVVMRLQRQQQDSNQRWDAPQPERPAPHVGRPAAPAVSKGEAARLQRQADLARAKARRREVHDGED